MNIFAILQNLPWNYILPVGVFITVFLFGYKYKASSVEKEEMEARLQNKEDEAKAQVKIIQLEQAKQKRLEELNEAFSKHDSSSISNFANRLFRQIFPPDGKDSK